MIEMRPRPRCFDCEMPVSSHAEGCECGVAVLCQDCRDTHELLHQQQPPAEARPLVDDETSARWLRDLDERIERKYSPEQIAEFVKRFGLPAETLTRRRAS